jgi:D-alanine-D-alanine ligase
MANNGIKVAVLYGGPPDCAEREVSLRSGAAVARGLAAAGCKVSEVDVQGADFALPRGVEVVFPVLHGTFGEDGQLQDILESKGVPYVGSGVLASYNAFDKVRSKQIFGMEGIPTPAYEILLRHGTRNFVLPLPVFVKPSRQGSSVGAHPVQKADQVDCALADAFQHDEYVLVEEFIAGKELTVGFVGDEPLPVIEVKPLDGWYDYTNKYTKGKTEYIVPAELPPAVTSAVQFTAKRAYLALGCRHMGRVDLMLGEEDAPQVLEVNTIPGFTDTSLLPKAARAAGIGFEQLCLRLVEMALSRAENESRAELKVA